MNIHFILFFCFLSALCGGHSGLVSAKLYMFAGAEGGNGTISCYLTKSGSRKFFCKDECKGEDILIKTDEVRAQSGRYSTEYREDPSGTAILSVTITHLIKSDSGWYRCGLGGSLVPDSYFDYKVRVVDAATSDVSSDFSHADVEGENITFGCLDTVYGEQKFLCRNQCTKQEDILIETNENRTQNGRYSIEYIEGSWDGLHVTITRATKSDSGWYSCGYGRISSPDSYYTTKILVIEAVSCTGYILPLIVCVSVVVTLLVVALILLYTCKKKWLYTINSRSTEVPVRFMNLTPASSYEDSTSKTNGE